LSIDAPFKLVLLDEFGRLDSANQATVIARLTHLVNEGVIDQFIVVGTEIPKAALTTSQLQVIHVAP
jgi:ABC-type phosphonate transport system ATPase subunit